MSIAVNCPTCGKKYNLNEKMAGKKVRCKHCAETFPVDLDAVLPVNGAAAPAPVASTQFKNSSGPPPTIDDDREDEDLPEVMAAPPKKGGFPIFWCVMAGVACLVLLVCSGLGFGVFMIGMNIRNNMAAAAARSRNNRPLGSGGFTQAPKTLADAVADVKSPDSFRQQQGADWLAKAAYSPADQPQVAKALEPRLNDFSPSVKTAAANALVVWAGPENVPALVKCLEMDDHSTVDPAIRALVRLRDPRAAAPLAKLLANWGRRGAAANALQSLGNMCEAEVVPYAFHPDQGTRDQAQRLLKGYGTKDDVLITQAIAELKNPDANRRTHAADWLAKTPVVEKRRDAVSVALNPVLKDVNEGARNNAVKAVKVWATKANVPTLCEMLSNPAWYHPFARDLRAILMATLIDLKDERATAVFCKDLATQEWKTQAKAGLDALGPAALPELMKCLSHADAGTRQGAAQTLAEFKVDEAKRAQVSALLEPLLKDQNAAVVLAGAKAAKVWGTKDNVPSLVKIVSSPLPPSRGNEHVAAAMEALVELKDERAYWPIAQWAGHRFPHLNEVGKKHLKAIGAAAEPEIVKHLTDADVNVRQTAWRALGVVGVKNNLMMYNAIAAQEKDFFTKTAIQEAMREIASRP